MKNIILVMLFTFVLTAEEISVPWGDGFEKGDVKDYFQRKLVHAALVKGAGVNGSRALVIDPEKAGPEKTMVRAFMKRIPVKHFVKYKFSFMGKIEGPDTFENNPLMEYIYFDAARGSKGKPLPGWELLFTDENDKKITRGAPLSAVMAHGSWTRYEEIFYAPPRSRELQIIFHNFMNMQNKMFIDDMKLEIIDEGALNINPDFRYGLYNYSGYSPRNSRIVELEKGKFAMDASPENSFSTTTIPVRPNQEYQLTAHLRSVDKRIRVTVGLSDINGKSLSPLKTNIELYPPNREETKSMSFITPENAAYVSIHGRNGIIKSLKLEEKK